MKDEKKVNEAEEEDVELTDEELAEVTGGLKESGPGLINPSQTLID